MVRGTSSIFTDKVGGLVLLGLAGASAVLLGFGKRAAGEGNQRPRDPSISDIRLIPNPVQIQDRSEVEVVLQITGGSGRFGGDIQFGDGSVFNFQESSFVEVLQNVFQLSVTHFYALDNVQQTSVKLVAQVQDSTTGILNTQNATVVIDPFLEIPIEEPPTTGDVITGFSQTVGSGEVPLVAGFSVSVGDPRSNVLWDFGDGSAPVADQKSLSHTYLSTGTFNGFVEVTNSVGQIERQNFIVVVTASLEIPTGDIISNFFQDKSIINQGSEVLFSLALGVPEQSILWDFGDGSPLRSNVLSVRHTYNQAGIFSGQVTVVAQDGRMEVMPFNVTVQESVQKISCRIDVFVPTGGLIISPNEIVDLRSNEGGGFAPFVNYEWDLGDGAVISGADKKFISHSYDSLGPKTISLTVTDSIGQQKTCVKQIDIKNAPLQGGDVEVVQILTSFTDAQKIKNLREITIDGRILTRVFAGRNQVFSRTNNAFLLPNGEITNIFDAVGKNLPIGVPLREIVEYKDNVSNKLLNVPEYIFDFELAGEIAPVGLPICTSSNALAIAQSIIDGTFPGAVPQWYIDDGVSWVLQGLITISEFCNGYNDLINRGIIV